jgi:hypothetical protein
MKWAVIRAENPLNVRFQPVTFINSKVIGYTP